MSDTYEPSQDEFSKHYSDPNMEVLRDDGLYRHLRFRFTSGGILWCDIVTWPGNLLITGDCNTFVFNRVEDMFGFFRSITGTINPRYWQEKILDGRDRAKSFDWDRFRAEALTGFDQDKEDDDDHELRTAARKDLEEALDATDPDEWGAVRLLREYKYQPDGYGTPVYFQFDLSESPPDGMGWDYHYIWCCRAIAWAINKYDESKVTACASNK